MFKKACSVDGGQVKNTGVSCHSAMGATAMIIPIDPKLKWTAADVGEDPYEWMNELIHLKKAFPLFGIKAPIRTITNSPEADVTVTLDDGSRSFVRYGIYNRTLQTTSGGLCYAEVLMSFLNSGLSLLEIDKTGKLLQRKNEDKTTFSGLLIDQMYAPSPVLADFKDVYRNQFQYSFDPTEMVNNGTIYEGANSLLSLTGLLDVDLIKGAGTATTLQFNVNEECAGTDLVALIGAPLAAATNFVVTNKTTGLPVSITAATIVGGKIQLTGTFVAGQTYIVTGAAPIVWFDADITGYDASVSKIEYLIA